MGMRTSQTGNRRIEDLLFIASTGALVLFKSQSRDVCSRPWRRVTIQISSLKTLSMRRISESSRSWSKAFLSEHMMARACAGRAGKNGRNVKLERLLRVMRPSLRVRLEVAKSKIAERHRVAKKRFVLPNRHGNGALCTSETLAPGGEPPFVETTKLAHPPVFVS